MRSLLIVVALLLLTGCSNTVQQPIDPSLGLDPALGRDPAEAQLAEAASSVSQSLVNLNKIQEAVTPPPPTFVPPDPANYGMANLVSIDWSGPIEPLIQQIAEATGYKVRIIGNQPAIPVMVYISAKNTPIGDVLRDAGYQCNDKADIVVFPSTKVIELRYAKA